MTSTPSVDDVVDAADGWHLFGTECPKEEVVFFCQVIILYTVIGLYRDVWIAAIASSRTMLATLTGAMCNAS